MPKSYQASRQMAAYHAFMKAQHYSRLTQMTEAQAAPSISKHTVIRFVDELEKAHQCFLYNKYLRQCDIITHNSIPDDISYELTWQNELKQEFPLVEEEDIYDLVHQYVRELEDKHWKGADHIQANRNESAIYRLLVQARVEGYVLEEKPETELEKLKKSHVLLYRGCCVHREPSVDVEVRTVTIGNISLMVSEKYLRLYFRSFGCIEKFRVERTSEWQIAHITFKDLAGVEQIKAYRGLKLPHICKCTESGCAPLLVHQKCVQAGSRAESVVEKVDDVNKMYVEALGKYDALRTLYSQFQPKEAKANEKEECCSSCRAMESGGYTVGGKCMCRSSINSTGTRRFKRQSGFKVRFKRRLNSRRTLRLQRRRAQMNAHG